MSASLRHSLLTAGGAIAIALGATACGPGEPGGSDNEGNGGDEQQTLTVFAAASLTDVFEQINGDFEADNPGVSVVMTNAGSSDLVTQIGQGAPADVLVTADAENMQRAQEEGLVVGEPHVFATNVLTIAVQPGNPRSISGLQDLAGDDITVTRCAAPVPCGTVADEVLADAGVTITPASEANSVTDVLGNVTSGEADAGLVYATDVTRAGGDAQGVPIEGAAKHATEYPIAVTGSSENPDLAAQYTEFVRSDSAQSVLADAGFGAP